MEQLWFEADLMELHANASRSAYTLALALRDADHLDSRAYDDIIDAIDRLKDAAPIDNGKRTVDISQYREISKSLDHVLTRLRRRLGLAMSQPARRPMPAGGPCGLALCLDRDTYPPGAKIHATVKSNGQFQRSKVTVTVLDEGLAVLARRDKRAPAQARGRPSMGIHAVSMIVRPKKLVDKHEYIVHAACGDMYDLAAFVVNDIAPTMRVDRQTCTPGDDIGVIVEDPGACAGGAGAESASGEKKRHFTAESPHKQIACRLEEVRHSPGTFCGQVRCAGVHTDGPARDAVSDAGRAEIDAIPCGPNQLIRIKYTRGSKEAKAVVLVERPGAITAAGSNGRGNGDSSAPAMRLHMGRP